MSTMAIERTNRKEVEKRHMSVISGAVTCLLNSSFIIGETAALSSCNPYAAVSIMMNR